MMSYLKPLRIGFGPAVSGLAALVSGCGIDSSVPVQDSALPAHMYEAAPVPEGDPLPIKVGVVYDEAFAAYSYTRPMSSSRDYVFPIGRASVETFDPLFPAVFREVEVVDSASAIAAANPPLDAVIRPSIVEFQYAQDGRARVAYRFELSEPGGAVIVRWTVAGAGAWKPPEGSSPEISVKSIASLVAAAAIRDAAGRFAAGIRDVPEIKRWMRQAGVEAAAPAAGFAGPAPGSGRISVAATPDLDRARQKARFGVDLSGNDVLAVDVVVRNDGPRPVLVRYDGIRLLAAGLPPLAAAPSNDAFEKSEPANLGGVAGAAFTPLLGVAIQADDVRQDIYRMTNFEVLKFKDARLRSGESASGVLYYVLPDVGSTQLGGASLDVRVVDVDTGTCSAARAPLGGAGEPRTAGSSRCPALPPRAAIGPVASARSAGTDPGRGAMAQSAARQPISPEMRKRVDSYLLLYRGQFERDLMSYTMARVPDPQYVGKTRAPARVMSYEILEATEQQVVLRLVYNHGGYSSARTHLFTLNWAGSQLKFVGHEEIRGVNMVGRGANIVDTDARKADVDPEMRKRVESYLLLYRGQFERDMSLYTVARVPDPDYVGKTQPPACVKSYEILAATEQEVVLKLVYANGCHSRAQTMIFTLNWVNGRLKFISHEDMKDANLG